MTKKSDLFIRMHLSAYESGLMAALGPQRWWLLCALATYMDKDGYCYPTHEQLAKKLNVDPRTVQRQIKKLLAFRWNGKPIIIAEKVPVDGKPASFERYTYTILPTSQLAIFTGQIEEIPYVADSHIADVQSRHVSAGEEVQRIDVQEGTTNYIQLNKSHYNKSHLHHSLRVKEKDYEKEPEGTAPDTEVHREPTDEQLEQLAARLRGDSVHHSESV
jgi:hypothetical protein